MEVTDTSDSRLELIGGSLRARFEKVAPGATVQHTYSVKPIVSGIVVAQPATVKYKPDSPTGTDVQVSIAP